MRAAGCVWKRRPLSTTKYTARFPFPTEHRSADPSSTRVGGGRGARDGDGPGLSVTETASADAARGGGGRRQASAAARPPESALRSRVSRVGVRFSNLYSQKALTRPYNIYPRIPLTTPALSMVPATRPATTTTTRTYRAHLASLHARRGLRCARETRCGAEGPGTSRESDTVVKHERQARRALALGNASWRWRPAAKHAVELL